MDKLKELKVDDDDSNRIVDAIYGLDKNGVRIPGLVDSNDEGEFRVKLSHVEASWPEKFVQWFHKSKLKDCVDHMLVPSRRRRESQRRSAVW